MNNGEPPTAYWDERDEIERCTECDWEVVRGVCQNPPCAMEFAYDSVRFFEFRRDELCRLHS